MSSGAEWAKQWAANKEKVHCKKCNENDFRYLCIKCSTCDNYFHKACAQPLRTDYEWTQDGDNLICDECADCCMVCGEKSEYDDNPLLLCDNCEELWHWECLEEDERCPEDELDDEDAEWYCPVCCEEYGDDMDWADEHIVADSQMAADECFTRSTCDCETCTSMNNAVDGWHNWQPENSIQQSMKNAIDAKDDLVNEAMSELHFRHGKPPPKN